MDGRMWNARRPDVLQARPDTSSFLDSETSLGLVSAGQERLVCRLSSLSLEREAMVAWDLLRSAAGGMILN